MGLGGPPFKGGRGALGERGAKWKRPLMGEETNANGGNFNTM